MYNLVSVTPTICKLMDVRLPKGATAPAIKEVLNKAEGKTIQKILLYAPDAIGEWLYQANKNAFKTVLTEAPVQIQIQSMKDILRRQFQDTLMTMPEAESLVCTSEILCFSLIVESEARIQI